MVETGPTTRASRRILATGKRKRIRPPLALAVQVHPADLIGQAVDQPGQLFGIAAKDAELLTVVRGHHIVQRFLQVVEDRNRHQGPELLHAVQLHCIVHRIQHRGSQQS